MIKTNDININPFIRDEVSPSYTDNIGETYNWRMNCYD